ncbi:UDP-N-acetylmuramate dehydrogenase [Scopulibacillus darangshiensis]|uniref:UDP-N-acetylenolpyruvoylglucosamine reductase n=1 Tax=Scopulibacillus darangshiensis TaxID=442528 RepID=A0A4R2P362_9BACL|nr:UDP-N-acetylmuramate dehydrogenase [Scopulibacillus darangshiensis]TCP29092.1 UDP-N-acetylmuramate dehydrogenase [Scopulibacillus darangshiensis]
MDEIYTKLDVLKVGKVRLNEPLAKHTTLRVGGPADLFVEPDSIDSLVNTMDVIKQYNLKWRAIGKGSNLLISDEGIRGVVIKLARGINHMELDGNRLLVGAGYPMVPLATILGKKGLSGFEFAGGIPGSVGGAVYMNAGAHGSDMSQVLSRARILSPNGELKWLSLEELAYSYRTSVLQSQQGICVEAEFELTSGDAKVISENLQAFKDYRHSTQPYDSKCCGSVFRNPLPNHAGKLIEDAGLKGYRLGGAQVSPLHGNFIVNADHARAQDVLDLIQFVKRSIKEKYNIDLHTEVEIIS